MLVDLIGFEPVFDGVYKSRKVVKIKGSNDSEERFTFANELIGLQRFRSPSEDEVIEYIRGANKELADNPDKYKDQTTGLIGLLKILHENIIGELQEECEETIDFLRANTPARNLEDGEFRNEFLLIRFGYGIEDLMDKIIEKAESPEERLNLAFETQFVNRVQIGENWAMNVLTYNPNLDSDLYEGVMPKKEEIRRLIAHGVEKSRTMVLRYGPNSTRNFQRIYNIIADAIGAEVQLNEVMDASETVLDTYCANAVIKFKEHKEERKNKTGEEKLEGKTAEASDKPTIEPSN